SHKTLVSLATGGILTDLTVLPDGSRVVATRMGGTPALWTLDTATHSRVAEHPLAGQPLALATAPDGAVLVALETGLVLRLNPDTGATLATGTAGGSPTGLAVAGNRLAVANMRSGDVSLLSYPELAPIARKTVGPDPQKVAASPDGTRFYVSVKGSNQVMFLAASDLATVASPEVATGPVGLALSPDGGWLYVACREGAALVTLDARTGAELHRTTPQPSSAPFGVVVVPTLR
ncbi:MAG: YncE family protein, partial [Candidatus Eremiobacterota bacterium]